jgi:hypothetical protein
MDFRRNAHGKSRSNCFSSSWFLGFSGSVEVVLVDVVCSMLAVDTYSRPPGDIDSDLGILIARDHSWTLCCILVISIKYHTIRAV